MPKQYSRKEFYDLVWSKPITHLAKDFGLSDVGIHKICKKHNIPNPPLGYWAKKTHGKAVTQTPLPRSSKDVADTILIVEGSFLSEPDSLRSAREQARINASAPEAQPPAARHSIVERTISSLLKAKVDARGLVSSAQQGGISVAVAPPSIKRVGAALDLLVAAASAQNFELAKSEKAIVFTGHETTIGFSVQETVKRVKHDLTAEELAEEERHKKKQRRDEWFSSFLFRRRFPEWDYLPTGQLAVEIEGSYSYSGSGPRKKLQRWKDPEDRNDGRRDCDRLGGHGSGKEGTNPGRSRARRKMARGTSTPAGSRAAEAYFRSATRRADIRTRRGGKVDPAAASGGKSAN